jgi:hypothetical protein
MKHNLFEGQSLNPKDRLDNLRSLAYSEDRMTFQKPLTPEQIDFEKERLSQAMIKLNAETERLDNFKQEIKAIVKPLELIRNESLEKIKNKAVQISGSVFLVDDQEAGMMGTYDDEGILIQSRRLLPEERQLHINSKFNKAV